jgi:type I restriction enzyme M protein
VLFFEKGKPTKKVWFYQLNLSRNLGKTNPLNESDLADFVKLQKTKADSENSWNIDIKDVDQKTFDLSVKNPNKVNEVALREPEDILLEIAEKDREVSRIISEIKKII